MHMSIAILFLIAVPVAVLAYDPVDLEIYDLVEEVGVQQSFYDILQIDKTASVAEIRRAYRKLSLILHPDKNDSPDAETKFRQLVSINEILKDSEKRKKYDIVLRDGLPDWRQPIYYYRKVKKLGLAELAVLLLVVLTIGHYVVSWVVYLEKAFELEELLAPVKKRREKKRAKGKLVSDDISINSTSDILEENYGYRKPKIMDLLPFLLYRSTVAFIRNIPNIIRDSKQKYEEYQERKRLEKEELDDSEEVEEKKPKPKKKKEVKLRDASEFEDELPVVNQVPNVTCIDEDENDEQINRADTDWTEDDLSALSRAMAKFPGGVPGRWDRIALEIGRTVQEVTKKVKEMKTSLSSSGSAPTTYGQSNVVGKRAAFQISDSVMTKAIDSELNPKSVITVTPQDLYTTQDEIPEDYDEGTSYNQQEDDDMEQYRQVRKRKVKTRPDLVENETLTGPGESETKNGNVAENEKESSQAKENGERSSAADFWTQVQQKCLETALAHIPKNKTDRWTHIARAVPGKSKEECIQRYKLLVEHVKKKKETDNSDKSKSSNKVE